ncbi:MAG: YdbL family protein [Candidatus Electrothrix sp. GW3-4]|uniref:YdbL family protein n=1 Tax=Candidatus Electrothrix sp. GW3-4 TaxID=3126740 RepID=UPI0030D389CE
MKNTITLLLFCLFTLLLCQPVFALDLQAAKAQGLVGETPTGYLDVVKASPDAQQLIKDINAKRKAHYQQIAKKNKTPLSAVEKLAGQKAMEKTPAGQYVKVGGKWQKK